MLTRELLEQMVKIFPLNGAVFRTEDAYKWFRSKYQGENWPRCCDEFIDWVTARALRKGYVEDPEIKGFFRKSEVLFQPQEIQARVWELATQIGHDYRADAPVFVGVLNACAPFMMDLLSVLPTPTRQYARYDFVQAASRVGTESAETVRILKDASTDLRGQDVIIVEGIVGTGRTLCHVIPLIEEKNPNSVNVCTLLNKPSRREHQVPIRYCGFKVPNVFVIGYGLDYNQRYRGLPFIGALN
jgi:hypoxanthine phosphoribosyltransferase